MESELRAMKSVVSFPRKLDSSMLRSSKPKQKLLDKTYNGGGNAYDMQKMPAAKNAYYSEPPAVHTAPSKSVQPAAVRKPYQGTDRPRATKRLPLCRELVVDNPKIQYHKGNFENAENAILFNMHGSQSTGLHFDENESVLEKPPRAIEGSAGSRIRVVLGATGHSFLLLCDEDDGEIKWQSKSWLNLPLSLDKKLREVEYVYQCSISPNNRDWFLTAKCGTAGTKKSFWNVSSKQLGNALKSALDGGLEVRVVFGDSKYGQYIILLGPNGYTLGNNLPEKLLRDMDRAYEDESIIARIRGLNTKGRYLMEEAIVEEYSIDETEASDAVRSIFHSHGLSPHLKQVLDDSVRKQLNLHEIAMGSVDLSWLTILDASWMGSTGIHDDLANLLDAFYVRHRNRQDLRKQEISIFNEELRLRQQQLALATAEARRKAPMERTDSDITETIEAEAEKASNRARQKAEMESKSAEDREAAAARARWEATAVVLHEEERDRASKESASLDSTEKEEEVSISIDELYDDAADESVGDQSPTERASGEETVADETVTQATSQNSEYTEAEDDDDNEEKDFTTESNDEDEVSLMKSDAGSGTQPKASGQSQNIGRQRKRERILGALQAAKTQSEKEDRLLEIQWKGLRKRDKVVVLGISTQAGDCMIEKIDHKEGVLRVLVPRKNKKKGSHHEKTVVSLQDARRVVKFTDYTDQFEKSELSMLAVLEDKYAAVAQVQHGHIECNSCPCKSVFTGFSQRALEQNPWRLGDKVHVVGFTDGTVTEKTRFKEMDFMVHVQYKDGSSYHVCADKIRPLKRIIPAGACAFQQKKEALDEGTLRIRRVFEELDKTKGQKQFNEFCCHEKIDVGRLQRLVDNLKSDATERRRLMHDLSDCLEREPENYKFDFCLRKLEVCYELEEAAYCLYDLLKSQRRDSNGCIVHEVTYKCRDAACRGRLFALGHTMRVIEDGFPRSLTLQGVPNELQRVMAGAFSHYVDCQNSDIRILCSLSTQLDMDHLVPTLMDYKNYRDMWLDAIQKEHPDCPHSEIKRLPNVILCGGSYQNWLQQVGTESVPKVARFTFRLYAETHALCDQLLRHPRFQWTLIERAELKKKDLEDAFIDMLLFSRILQACENEIIGIMHRSFHQCGWKVRAKLFDSLLVEETSTGSLDEAIKDAEDACALQDWDVKLVEKPHFGLMDDELKCVTDARAILNAVSKEVSMKDNTSVLTENS